MKWLLRVLCTLAVLTATVWAASVGFLWANEPRLVFRAHATRPVRLPLDDALFSRVMFTSADGVELEGAVLTAPGSRPDAYWILFCPGAGNSIHFRRVQSQLEQLAGVGYNVFAFDYRGFGRTLGVPTEEGLYQDAVAAYTYLTTVLGAPAARVILAGRSLGSAVAVDLAARVPSAGVLLLSPIESVPATAALLYPWVPASLLARNRFDSSEKIVRINAPIVVVHSATDRLVPIGAARRLFARARNPKLMLETGGGHNRAGFSPVSELVETLSRFWPIALESAPTGLAVAGLD